MVIVPRAPPPYSYNKYHPLAACVRVCVSSSGVLNHGNHFHDIYEPCADDPSSWCGRYDGGQPGPTPNQYRSVAIPVLR